jgi:RNA recognition motif-containing protein
MMGVPTGPRVAPNVKLSEVPIVPPEDRFKCFISNLPADLSDGALEQILNVPGPLISLKRIKDAEGKPKSFGFAEFGDAETVLRCLEVVNGCKVKGASGEEKAITVSGSLFCVFGCGEFSKFENNNHSSIISLHPCKLLSFTGLSHSSL